MVEAEVAGEQLKTSVEEDGAVLVEAELPEEGLKASEEDEVDV